MQTRLRAFYPWRKSFRSTFVFGHSSRSMMSLEIKGMGPRGRIISEKFLYLAKELGLKLPLRRFVLCVEDHAFKELDDETKGWIELPLLILFLSLASQIPFARLDDCVSSGSVSPTGDLIVPGLSKELLNGLNTFAKRTQVSGFKYIGPQTDELPEGVHLIPLEMMFSEFPNIRISQEKYESR